MIWNSRFLATAAAALTLGAATFVPTTEADARWRGRSNGAAVAAGVIGGLALGAIASSAAQPRYYDYGYGYGYDPYYAAPAYGGPVYYDGGYAYDSYYAAPAYRYRYAEPVYPRRGLRASGGNRNFYGDSAYNGQGGRSRLDSDTSR